MDIFSATIERIELAYEQDFEYRLGWRFLFTPARTLSENTKMLLVGIDPGGRVSQENQESVEKGNAYRVEVWPGGKEGGPNPLQKQVQAFFDILAAKLDHQSRNDLMDHTMTSNMFPIRTGGWSKIGKVEQKKAIDFSSKLWFHIFDHISPSVIVCIGKPPYECFRRVLLNKGYTETERPKERRVGLKNDTYSQSRYERGDKRTLMIGLPYLRRSMIFSKLEENPERREAVDSFTEAIAQALRQP